MSEGTRGQLFLARRPAAVERHADAREPKLFIADDVLINTDDDRTAAGLRASADLNRST